VRFKKFVLTLPDKKGSDRRAEEGAQDDATVENEKRWVGDGRINRSLPSGKGSQQLGEFDLGLHLSRAGSLSS